MISRTDLTFEKNASIELPLIRKKFIYKIPIKSNAIFEFNHHYYHDQADAMSKFIKKTLKHDYGVKIKDTLDGTFREILKNAFDSYAQAGLIPGNEFILEIVIKEKNQKIIVNIMDNGGGFDNQPKNKYFKRDDIKPKNKVGPFFGGERVGLFYSEGKVLANRASLFFKNRKQGGATVSIQLDRQPSSSYGFSSR